MIFQVAILATFEILSNSFSFHCRFALVCIDEYLAVDSGTVFVLLSVHPHFFKVQGQQKSEKNLSFTYMSSGIFLPPEYIKGW